MGREFTIEGAVGRIHEESKRLDSCPGGRMDDISSESGSVVTELLPPNLSELVKSQVERLVRISVLTCPPSVSHPLRLLRHSTVDASGIRQHT